MENYSINYLDYESLKEYLTTNKINSYTNILVFQERLSLNV